MTFSRVLASTAVVLSLTGVAAALEGTATLSGRSRTAVTKCHARVRPTSTLTLGVDTKGSFSLDVADPTSPITFTGTYAPNANGRVLTLTLDASALSLLGQAVAHDA